MPDLGFINTYYVANGKVCELIGSEFIDSEITIYEVLKVVGEIPLFFEDHIERLENSLAFSKITGYTIDQQGLRKELLACCKANSIHFGNIEIRITKVKSGELIRLIGFIPHNYPLPTDYLHGVALDTIKAERNNPIAKVKHSKTRLKANNYLKKHSVFEVLLENNLGQLTEGSRSNVFFIKGSLIFTAPNKCVLQGISRKYVITAINNLGFELVESLVKTTDLHTVDAAFLCGTSIGILPIKSIAKIEFDTHEKILRELIQEFNVLASSYLEACENKF